MGVLACTSLHPHRTRNSTFRTIQSIRCLTCFMSPPWFQARLTCCRLRPTVPVMSSKIVRSCCCPVPAFAFTITPSKRRFRDIRRRAARCPSSFAFLKPQIPSCEQCWRQAALVCLDQCRSGLLKSPYRTIFTPFGARDEGIKFAAGVNRIMNFFLIPESSFLRGELSSQKISRKKSFENILPALFATARAWQSAALLAQNVRFQR